MTAQELIQFLKQVPPNTKVGRIGYYGEFHKADKFSFQIRNIGHRSDGEQVVDILPPDIGPEPD